MNVFFIYNCGYSILIFFMTLNNIELSQNTVIDTILKIITFVSMIWFIFVRGRKAVEIKNGYLYCNSYPFYHKFLLSNISKLSVENKKVTITLNDSSIHETTYFFGIESAISQEVASKFLNTDVTS